MITDERLEDLHKMFWSETNENWTREWREELTDEEDALIYEWDEEVSRGFMNLCTEILRLQKIREDSSK